MKRITQDSNVLDYNLITDAEVANDQIDVSTTNGGNRPPIEILPVRDEGMLYTINENPPFYLCIILAFQQFLTAIGGTITIPIIMASHLCLSDGVVLSEYMGTLLFVSGITTLLQTTIGVRLPIVQGCSFSFLIPAFSLMSVSKWPCPDSKVSAEEVLPFFNESVENVTLSTAVHVSDEIWKYRLQELAGAVVGSSLLQVIVGATGIVGVLVQFIGPIVVASTIALVGLSITDTAVNKCALSWPVSMSTVLLIILFSQYFTGINIPCPSLTRKKVSCGANKLPVFKLFPIILAIIVAWFVCWLLTITSVFRKDPEHFTYFGRTDRNSHVLTDSRWFRIPYPCQWGMPIFSLAGILGMLTGVIAVIIESIGDFYACAKMSGAPNPPTHAVNRGILMEGIGTMLAGLFGCGLGLTSFSGNIAVIGVTRVGSRRVVQTAGIILLVIGVLGKVGAIFVSIPEPIIGGILMGLMGMISAVGISNLQHTNMNSSRNLFVFGFSVFFGLSVPRWMTRNTNAINTGNDFADNLFTILLQNTMFVGGAISIILDNTIPGTDAERGLHVWKAKPDISKSTSPDNKCYKIPFTSSIRRGMAIWRHIPFSSDFTGFGRGKTSEKVYQDIKETDI